VAAAAAAWLRDTVLQIHQLRSSSGPRRHRRFFITSMSSARRGGLYVYGINIDAVVKKCYEQREARERLILPHLSS